MPGINTGLGSGSINTGGGGGINTGLGGGGSHISPTKPPKFLGASRGPQAKPHPSQIGGKLDWLTGKLALAGHDLYGMPGGIYHAGLQLNKGRDDLLTGHPGRALHDVLPMEKGLVKGTYESFRHPGRDPFMTILNAAPVADVAGRAAEAGLAARAADVAAGESRIGEAAKALTAKHGAEPPRILKKGDLQTNLIPSRNAGARLVTRGYDRLVQNAMDKEESGAKIGRVGQKLASHGVQRIKGALAEEGRVAQRINEVPSNRLDRAAAHLNIGKLPRAARENQAALELTSTQTLPEEAARYHETQAAKFHKLAENASTSEEAQAHLDAAEQNDAVAKLYRRVGKRNLVLHDESKPVGEQVHINPAEKSLALTDERLAGLGHRGDQMLLDYGQMTPEGIQTAIDNPGRVRAGAEYETPTPAKQGVPAHVLKEAEAQVAKLEKLHARAAIKAMGDTTKRGSVMGEVVGHGGYDYQLPWEHSPIVKRLSGALSIARDRLQTLEEQAARREKPTGIIGGEDARPGRTHISYRPTEAKAQVGPARRFVSNVTGRPASPVTSHEFTGESIRQGQVPNDVTGMKSRAYRVIARHANSVEQARKLFQSGSDVSRGTGHEMLFANPDTGLNFGRGEWIPKQREDGTLDLVKRGKPGTDERQALGTERATFDKAHELNASEHDMAETEGVKAALQQIAQGWFSQAHETAGRVAGRPAPEGFRWVDSRLAQDLQDMISPKTGKVRDLGAKIGRGFDNINSAITTATVYTKIGHTFTRGFTNAATNIMQGSLAPDELARTWKFEKDAKAALGAKYGEFRERLMAGAGQLGYEALPHEGTEGVVGRSISKAARMGSGFWAHGVGRFPGFDAPFRINSLLYELRKSGYTTPEQVDRALEAMRTGGRGLAAHEWSKVSVAFRRADREAISYDRLNQFERSFMSRGIWFYPWVKGSTMWTLRSIAEHPYKMSLLGNLGAQGRQEQMRQLGPVPSYEQGLIDVGGSKSQPYTVDMSTFSPVGSAAQIANIPNTPGGLAQTLNPAAGSLIQGAEGINQYGEPDTNAWHDALLNLAASTPESQIFGAASGKSHSKMFPTTSWQSEVRRYLLGPGIARRPTNRADLAKAAKRQHQKQFSVYYGP